MNALKSVVKSVTVTAHSNMHLSQWLFFLGIFEAFTVLRTHRLPKLMDFEGTMAHIQDSIGLGQSFSVYYAIFANVFCAFLVMLGLLTRWASLAIITITLSGLFIVHITDPAKVQDAPLIYSTVFISPLIFGPEVYALDAILEKKSKP